jgi:protein-disulfide isomerase
LARETALQVIRTALRRWWLGGLAVALLVGAAPSDGRAQEQLPQEEVERIVREYLLREPEIIMQAIEELQRRREAQAAADQRDRLASEQEALVADARDPVLGNPDGDVTLVEFFDYRCGYCRIMAEPMQELIAQDPELRIVMKEFPILGPDSLLASRAALAAHRQGGYEAMHWALLAANRIDEAVIRELAEDQGLDVDQLLADMQAEPVAAHIQENIRLAQGLNINGTPSFVIGQTVLPGAVPVERLVGLVAEEREAGGG